MWTPGVCLSGDSTSCGSELCSSDAHGDRKPDGHHSCQTDQLLVPMPASSSAPFLQPHGLLPDPRAPWDASASGEAQQTSRPLSALACPSCSLERVVVWPADCGHLPWIRCPMSWGRAVAARVGATAAPCSRASERDLGTAGGTACPQLCGWALGFLASRYWVSR